MATGASHNTLIHTSSGKVTLGQLYSAFVSGSVGGYRVAYVNPDDFTDVGYMNIDTVYNEKCRMGVTLTTEDDRTVTVAATGYVIDVAEDDPTRMTVRHPTDAKCIVGPVSIGSKKMIVRKIVKREFCVITCIGLPVPNMITDKGFIIVC